MDLDLLFERVFDRANVSLVAFALLVIGTGLMSMALIQTCKDMFPLRRYYQRSRLRHWLAGLAKEARDLGQAWPLKTPPPVPDPVRAAAGDENAFYDLPIEQLCGQMNAAVQLAIDHAERYPSLVACLGGLVDPRDVALVLAPPPRVRGARESLGDDERAAVDAFVDARSHYHHQVERGIDRIQIAVGFRWKWWLQLASIVLSGIIGLAGYLKYGGTPRYFGHGLLVLLVTGVFGGFIAAVARDLIAGLQSLRGRR